MFRPMRRPKNAIPDEQAKKLLREEKRGVIEEQVQSLLFNLPDGRRPRIVG